VVLTVGVVLEQLRMVDWSAGVQFAILAALAVLLLWLGLQEQLDGGPPPAHVSVLLTAGLLVAWAALLRLADWVDDPFGGEDPPAGTFFWTGALEALLAGWISARRRSSIAALIAAVAGGGALVALYIELFDTESITPVRWLLLLLAIAFSVTSLPLRGTSQRHAEQMVNAAGLSVLVIGLLDLPALLFGGGDGGPAGWELVVLAGGLGLVAYAAADNAPGAAYLGVANLVVFAAVAAGEDDSLLWWPAILIVGGLALLGIGLRPRVPLPPPPEASTAPRDQPLAARTDDGDDSTFRVHLN
jgi:peptidoglycan/LPS O-acetylase OafA/YrhL